MEAPAATRVNSGPCVDGPWAGQSLSHRTAVRPVAGVVKGSKVGQLVGSYVWHPASREWRWLAIGVPWS